MAEQRSSRNGDGKTVPCISTPLLVDTLYQHAKLAGPDEAVAFSLAAERIEELQRELAAAVSERREPSAWLVESEYEKGGVTVRERQYHDSEATALDYQKNHGGKLTPLYERNGG